MHALCARQPEVNRKTGYRRSKATAEELHTRKVEEKAQQRQDSRQDTKMPAQRTGVCAPPLA